MNEKMTALAACRAGKLSLEFTLTSFISFSACLTASSLIRTGDLLDTSYTLPYSPGASWGRS